MPAKYPTPYGYFAGIQQKKMFYWIVVYFTNIVKYISIHCSVAKMSLRGPFRPKGGPEAISPNL